MALTAARKSQKWADYGLVNIGIAANAVCLQGGLAIAASGYARPGRAGQGANDLAKANDAATYRALGLFVESKTGGAVDGTVTIDVEEGVFLFKNSAGADAIAQADLERYCFIVDDETVALTSAGGTRARAGVVREVGSDGVWVEIGARVTSAPERKIILPFAISEADTLAGTSAELVSPAAGRITKLSAIVQKAVTTGGDLTAAVGVTAVDGLACTIADAAAKGTIVEDVPTAGHASAAVAVGSRVQVVPAAAFATAGAISGFVEITY